MGKKIFYILEGNNGATYIINTTNTEAIKLSLKFYKASTIKQKVMKSAFKMYLSGLRQLSKAMTLDSLKSQDEIGEYLEKEIGQTIDFNVDTNCSVLISPTRDKVIVHHHGEYFHKFAFGKSYNNVKNEAQIYGLLDKPLQHFKVSTFYDLEDNAQKEFCSFKLGYAKTSPSYDVDLTSALVEMFTVTKQENVSWSTYLESLKERCQQSGLTQPTIDSALDTLEESSSDAVIPLGLVHRDFKPWNINDENGLLIYDFEEAVTDGPPLEDLFNFYIDPIVRYVSSTEVTQVVFREENVEAYTRYLQMLHIDLDFKPLLYSYCIERALFWYEANEEETVGYYVNLLEYLVIEYK